MSDNNNIKRETKNMMYTFNYKRNTDNAESKQYSAQANSLTEAHRIAADILSKINNMKDEYRVNSKSVKAVR